jgi:hypothetical protein
VRSPPPKIETTDGQSYDRSGLFVFECDQKASVIQKACFEKLLILGSHPAQRNRITVIAIQPARNLKRMIDSMGKEPHRKSYGYGWHSTK